MQILPSAERQRMPENFDGVSPATHLNYCDASHEDEDRLRKELVGCRVAGLN